MERVNSYTSESKAAINRSKYLVTCTHSQKPLVVKACEHCMDDAKQRSVAVARGLYNISLTETIPDYAYAACFSTDQGKIQSEVFRSYSKPEISCLLQCLSSNPADLHPLFLAEDQTFYWNILWFYRSVYEALLESCGEKVVRNNVFGNLKQCRSNKIARANLPCGPLPFNAVAAFLQRELSPA